MGRDRRRGRIGVAGAMALLFVWTAVVPSAPVHVEADGPPVVSIDGNDFLVDGLPFVPRGFNSIALLNSQWCTERRTLAAADGFTLDEIDRAKNMWLANTLRFQVSQPVLSGVNGAAYAAEIEQDVAPALAAGFVVIISMQDQSRACGRATPLPAQATKTAWTTLITNTDLETNPSIMFELFNEPQNSELTTPTTNPRQFTWVDWLNGGRLISPSSGNTWTSYVPVGHQELVDLMRNDLEVTNVLIADGGRHAAHLEGMPMLVDPGPSYQIAYAVHPYYYTVAQSQWDLRWGDLARTNAVVATEWNYVASGCGTTSQSMAPQFFDYMRNTINVGILGHSLDSYDDLTTGPALLPTKCGTSTPGAGADFFNMYMATFAPPIEIPTPTDLAGTAVGGTRIGLAWAPPVLDQSTLGGYRVYRNGTLVATVVDPAYSDTSVQNGTTYRYRVDAFDTMWRTSPQTDEVPVSTLDEPAAPTIGTAVAGDSSATVRWSGPSDDGGSPITRFDVRVIDNATSAQVGSLRTAPASDSSLVVTGLTNGRAYRFQVAAVNDVGSSPWSASSNTVTPLGPALVPDAPSIGTATASNAAATVRWTAPAGNGGPAITRYEVRVLNDSTGAQVGSLRTASATASSLRVTGLSNGTAYRFEVRAVNGVGPSSWSVGSNSVTPANVPSAPIIGTATRGASGGALTATANWSAPSSTGGSPITGYRVYTLRMSSSSSSASVRSTTLSAVLGPTVRQLSLTLANGNYRFQVVAINAIGTSARSARSNNVVPR